MTLTLIVLLGSAASAQEPVFRAGVASVKVDVQVSGRNGRIISDLTAADFQVYDEGQPQKIVYFGHESEPVDVMLVLDVSGSMHRFLQEMADTALAALRQLHPGDRVGVMVFARSSAVRVPPTDDFAAVRDEIRNSVRDRSLGSGTAINSAIISAAQFMRKQPVRGRRAVVIVTDNMSLNYKVPDEEVIRSLNEADTVLNAILIGKQKHPDALPSGSYVNPDFTPSDVFKLAQATGGDFLEAKKGGETFLQMIERIRARYNIQYDAPPSSAGAYHEIRVELTPAARKRYPRAVVLARAGYYATLR